VQAGDATELVLQDVAIGTDMQAATNPGAHESLSTNQHSDANEAASIRIQNDSFESHNAEMNDTGESSDALLEKEEISDSLLEKEEAQQERYGPFCCQCGPSFTVTTEHESSFRTAACAEACHTQCPQDEYQTWRCQDKGTFSKVTCQCGENLRTVGNGNWPSKLDCFHTQADC